MTFDITSPNTSHVAESLVLLLEQFKGKTIIAALLTSWIEQIQELEVLISSLYTSRTLEASEGVQLDGIGEIVGVSRLGSLTDDDYRLRIKAQIALNRSSGTVEEILNILMLLIGVGSEAEIDSFDPVLEEGTLLRLLCQETVADAALIDTAPDPHTFTNDVASGGVVGIANGLANGLVGFGSRTFNNGVSEHASQKATAKAGVVEQLRSGDWSLRILARNENAVVSTCLLLAYGGRSGGSSPADDKCFLIESNSSGTFRMTMEKLGPNDTFTLTAPASSLNVVRQYDIVVKGDIDHSIVEMYVDGAFNVRFENVVRDQAVSSGTILCVVGMRYNTSNNPTNTFGWLGKIGPIDLIARARTAAEIAESFTHRRSQTILGQFVMREGVEAEFNVEALDPLLSEEQQIRMGLILQLAKAAGVRATFTSYLDSEHPFAFSDEAGEVDGNAGFDAGEFVNIS